MISVPQLHNSFHLEDNVWWVSAGKKQLQLVVARSVEKEMIGERPTGRPVVQTGVSASQAKVFKVHAAPQGVCENLINALELLANHQKDGDCPVQSSARGLRERSRKRHYGGTEKLY